jgi:hypothetical protein
MRTFAVLLCLVPALVSVPACSGFDPAAGGLNCGTRTDATAVYPQGLGDPLAVTSSSSSTCPEGGSDAQWKDGQSDAGWKESGSDATSDAIPKEAGMDPADAASATDADAWR